MPEEDSDPVEISEPDEHDDERVDDPVGETLELKRIRLRKLYAAHRAADMSGDAGSTMNAVAMRREIATLETELAAADAG